MMSREEFCLDNDDSNFSDNEMQDSAINEACKKPGCSDRMPCIKCTKNGVRKFVSKRKPNVRCMPKQRMFSLITNVRSMPKNKKRDKTRERAKARNEEDFVMSYEEKNDEEKQDNFECPEAVQKPENEDKQSNTYSLIKTTSNLSRCIETDIKEEKLEEEEEQACEPIQANIKKKSVGKIFKRKAANKKNHKNNDDDDDKQTSNSLKSQCCTDKSSVSCFTSVNSLFAPKMSQCYCHPSTTDVLMFQ